jgi:aspartyl aminopeptidase
VSFAVGHVDSPCLKVRPISKRTKVGYLQVGCELYGGGLWHTWFDRDLSLAGRVIVATPGATRGFTSKLVKIDRPILRIPTLAIHLDRNVNEQLKFNKETEFLPVLGLVNDTLNGPGSGAATPAGRAGTPANDDSAKLGQKIEEKHHPLLLAVIADELGCNVDDINDFELCLYDTQPSAVGGLNNEFIFSPRLDNLMTSYCTIEGLCDAVEAETASGKPSAEENIRCVILFDNEEVGSVSHHGAHSNLLPSFVEMVCGLSSRGYYQVLANSYLISADMGHAIHPNYESRYETNNHPRINQGVVIKTNANQRYTSNAQTTFLLRRIAQRGGVPVQEFEIRNDSVS